MELVDMLIEGSHRISADEHHTAARMRDVRIAQGKEALRIRQEMSNSLGRHLNYNLTEKGKIWE
jgi:hypothetical protein